MWRQNGIYQGKQPINRSINSGRYRAQLKLCTDRFNRFLDFFFFFPSRNERYGDTHAHDSLSKQTRRRRRRGWEERGRTTKSCGCSTGARSQGTDTAAVRTGPQLGQTRLKAETGEKVRRSRRQLAAISPDSLGLRSNRPQLFRRHFSVKMADTPLPPRCAPAHRFRSLLQIQSCCCAPFLVNPTAETFRRMSVPSRCLYVTSCPYLKPLRYRES